MADAVLYDFWLSSASYRIRIGLGLKGLTWDAVSVDLVKGDQQSSAHLARNPQGLVPVLDLDGKTLSQSVAILEYLDETRPEPAFLPPDPEGRMRVRQLAHVIAMETHPVNNSGVLAHVEEVTGGGPQSRLDWMAHFMPKGLSAFEALLNSPMTGRFCHGDTPGLADILLVPQMFNAYRWKVPTDAYPRMRAIVEACAEVPAFAAAEPKKHRPT